MNVRKEKREKQLDTGPASEFQTQVEERNGNGLTNNTEKTAHRKGAQSERLGFSAPC